MDSWSRRCVWLTGLSGAGKTFVGDYLMTYCGFVHIEGDTAMRDPRHAEITKDLRSAYEQIFSGQPGDPALWQPYLCHLCRHVRDALAEDPKRDVVVTFSVYTRAMRDYCRQELPGVRFALLACPKEEVIQRALPRAQKYFQIQGTTLDSAFPGGTEAFLAWQQRIVTGLEPLAKDEACDSITLDASARSQKVCNQIRQWLALPESQQEQQGDVDLAKIAQIQIERWRSEHLQKQVAAPFALAARRGRLHAGTRHSDRAVQRAAPANKTLASKAFKAECISNDTTSSFQLPQLSFMF
eukprot:gb/GEZN01005516.1/.p1 GENE.gb/GEZN01005516.1/~~gb/GEZN01005516.1/.p1  ORF type:complete len:297 (+),score=45.23 gb/GEZN01005516.1/:23-913(+)